eukprot:TRINITY_DN419_c0_g1_i1.p1 TRINITY_DN419_c0_g1~~TRINITY_DN419_c0_g1_i1.p1  ORF type:complete len:395 (-),score=110.73 TRINITY_DN419_c0_g1_i1:41-1225(-)
MRRVASFFFQCRAFTTGVKAQQSAAALTPKPKPTSPSSPSSSSSLPSSSIPAKVKASNKNSKNNGNKKLDRNNKNVTTVKTPQSQSNPGITKARIKPKLPNNQPSFSVPLLPLLSDAVTRPSSTSASSSSSSPSTSLIKGIPRVPVTPPAPRNRFTMKLWNENEERGTRSYPVPDFLRDNLLAFRVQAVRHFFQLKPRERRYRRATMERPLDVKLVNKSANPKDKWIYDCVQQMARDLRNSPNPWKTTAKEQFLNLAQRILYRKFTRSQLLKLQRQVGVLGFNLTPPTNDTTLKKPAIAKVARPSIKKAEKKKESLKAPRTTKQQQKKKKEKAESVNQKQNQKPAAAAQVKEKKAESKGSKKVKSEKIKKESKKNPTPGSAGSKKKENTKTTKI